MLIAAAVCPQPPILVPQVAGAAAAELDPLRAACDEAVGRLVAARPDIVVVIGAGPRTADHPAAAAGSLAAYGVDLSVGPGPAVLPLSLTLGRWLAERSGAAPAGFTEIAADAAPEECLRSGAALAASAPRVAALVMGDGSARRDESSPGRFDERAAGYDAAVADALGTADVSALAALRPDLADALLVGGRAAWQVLAGAAKDAAPTGRLLAAEAPYGVGYFVALWSADSAPERASRSA
ncbi:hypothetical protein CLV63_101458 [Murinocardiopsis flavida]|uniref:Catalytic LigB subunit of aromatic ring-opening dioxygenase n=1 Tax=Murinocardiopsis flavida TaxID=645275 RepID=A0A2P8DUS4_9ACTN|nr:class III extradiol dioxygenase subunit B-like domain-containing protein [Murinocardiopsis flavida]PSL00979.1 hypothetical protein CLV63_101458 [Murinocardiopsis flavida]